MTATSSNTIMHQRNRRTLIVLAALAGIAIAVVAIGRFHHIETQAVDKDKAAEDKPDALNGEDAQDEKLESVRLSPEVARKYGIRVGVATKREIVSSIIAPGRLTFNTEATVVVGTPVVGRVKEINVRAGDKVKQGAELVVIESIDLGELESDFLEKRTAAATARACLGPATSIYARVRKLYEESQGVSLTELQNREVEVRQAEGALANAEAASAAAENKLRFLGFDSAAITRLSTLKEVDPLYVIRSPLAGQVIERTVNLGELVKPEREKLLVVADTSSLWAWADIPESRVHEVAVGAAAQINVATGIGRTFAGTVTYVAPSVDLETRSLPVRVELKSDPDLKPGMFVQVAIRGNTRDETTAGVLAVPESAIETINGKTAVFIPVKDEVNRFQVRVVVTGGCADGLACVTSGLAEGEHIVISGTSILKADLLKSSAKDED